MPLKPGMASTSTATCVTAPSAAKSNEELEAISHQNQLNSTFLRLPAEIRNRIYLHGLGGHEIYALPSGLRPVVCMGRPNYQLAWNLKPIAQIMALHLPLVCRQIRSETGNYFAFKFNSFGAMEPIYFSLIMNNWTAEQKNNIEVVRVNCVRARPSASHETFVGHIWQRRLKELKKLRLLVLRDMDGLSPQEVDGVVCAFREAAGNDALRIEVVRIG